MKDLWPVQPRFCSPQKPHWACHTLSSKYQPRLKGLSGPLTIIHWLLYSVLLYGASSGTIIRWLSKEPTVHVWIAILFGSWCHLLPLVPSHLMALAIVWLESDTCEVRPRIFREVMRTLGMNHLVCTWDNYGLSVSSSRTVQLGQLSKTLFVHLEIGVHGTSNLSSLYFVWLYYNITD